MESLKAAFVHLMTGKDNQTHDLGKWSWLCSFVAVLALALWHECQHVAVTLTELAGSLCAVAGAHAATLKLKAATEPEVKK
jgi:hypothetical protein